MLPQGVARTLYCNRLFFVFFENALKVEKNLSENASDMLVQIHAGTRFRRSSHSVRHLSTEACVTLPESLFHTLLIDGARSFTRGVEAEKKKPARKALPATCLVELSNSEAPPVWPRACELDRATYFRMPPV